MHANTCIFPKYLIPLLKFCNQGQIHVQTISMSMMRKKTQFGPVIYLLKIDTFRNKGAYNSGSSITSGACSISFFAYSSASIGLKDQINFWKFKLELFRLYLYKQFSLNILPMVKNQTNRREETNSPAIDKVSLDEEGEEEVVVRPFSLWYFSFSS